MQKENCYQLGYITRTHGTRGEVILFLDVDFPEDYDELDAIFLEIKGEFVPYFIENINLQKDSRAIVRFESVSSIEVAKTLVGSTVFLPDDNLEELDDTQFYYHEITGFEVEDAKLGKIGTVTTVYTMPIQDLVAVSYNGQEALIPVNDEIIPRIDREKKTLHVNLPDGLLDVYSTDKHEPDDAD